MWFRGIIPMKHDFKTHVLWNSNSIKFFMFLSFHVQMIPSFWGKVSLNVLNIFPHNLLHNFLVCYKCEVINKKLVVVFTTIWKNKELPCLDQLHIQLIHILNELPHDQFQIFKGVLKKFNINIIGWM